MKLKMMDRQSHAQRQTAVQQDIGSENYYQTIIRRFKRHHLATVSLAVIAVIVGAALLAPVIAPYEPNDFVGPFA